MADKKEKNAHITETAPKNVAPPAKGIAKGYVPGGPLTRETLLFVTETAWNSQENVELTWEELDGSFQRSLFDVANDICSRGGAVSPFEQAVADTFAQLQAGEITPPVPVAAPAEKEDEKDQAA